jgi:hypothetical protein
MSDYKDSCQPPIPIGKQRYAYQCENVFLEPIHGAISIRGYKPFSGGKEPYPNREKDQIDHYDLKIEKFTGNSITIEFTKTFKDKRQEEYMTTVSFAQLVNLLFTGQAANVFIKAAPINKFENEGNNT